MFNTMNNLLMYFDNSIFLSKLNLTNRLRISFKIFILFKMHSSNWWRYCFWRDHERNANVKCLFQLNCNVLIQWFIWSNTLSNDVFVKNYLQTSWFKFLNITMTILLIFWSWCVSLTQARFHANFMYSRVIVCFNLNVLLRTLTILINELTTY
jgi:hypothetical protein